MHRCWLDRIMRSWIMHRCPHGMHKFYIFFFSFHFLIFFCIVVNYNNAQKTHQNTESLGARKRFDDDDDDAMWNGGRKYCRRETKEKKNAYAHGACKAKLFVQTKFRTKNTQVIVHRMHLLQFYDGMFRPAPTRPKISIFLLSANGQAQGQRTVLFLFFQFFFFFAQNKKMRWKNGRQKGEKLRKKRTDREGKEERVHGMALCVHTMDTRRRTFKSIASISQCK